jgi:hypothetical protein
MGLDMWLVKDYFIWANKEKLNITGLSEKYKIDTEKVCGITMDIAYWRKANQIHKWFVDNVQNGVDDCKKYYVPTEKLIELRNICQEILDIEDKIKRRKRAKELLPTQIGCFFGSTDYDDYYFKNLENTIEQLKDVDINDVHADYYYQSGW